MAENSKIEWTDATWNPIGGCSRVSEGCRNCYAEVMAARFSDPGQWGHGLATRVKRPDGSTDYRWTGKVQLNEKALIKPLLWKKPRRIFVNSTSDLFHESVPGEWIDQAFAVMALCPQHTFQILTKRPERAREYFRETAGWRVRVATLLNTIKPSPLWNGNVHQGWQNLHGRPDGLPNVWLGTSVEDQAAADVRIPHLKATPAAVRFLSCEPLLGPLRIDDLTSIGWVICGGESGPNARPMHPDWARSLRDQCQAAGVPFFFKQWGEWGPGSVVMTTGEPVFRTFKDRQTWINKASTWVNGGSCFDAAGRECRIGADFMRAEAEGTFPVTVIHKVGKARAGRLLDGREWNEFPNG